MAYSCPRTHFRIEHNLISCHSDTTLLPLDISPSHERNAYKTSSISPFNVWALPHSSTYRIDGRVRNCPHVNYTKQRRSMILVALVVRIISPFPQRTLLMEDKVRYIFWPLGIASSGFPILNSFGPEYYFFNLWILNSRMINRVLSFPIPFCIHEELWHPPKLNGKVTCKLSLDCKLTCISAVMAPASRLVCNDSFPPNVCQRPK